VIEGLFMSAQETGDIGKLVVLIVEDESTLGMGLRQKLETLGHTVLEQASTAERAKAFYREHRPDLVLLDIRLDGADGIDLASELLAERRCAMIILTSHGQQELVTRAAGAGVFGYVLKPVSLEALRAAIEVAVRRFREHEQLVAEKEQLAQNLETRKLVEKAKGIFMKRLNLDEPEAHRRLQLESQKRRISLNELAKRIIESDEFFNPGLGR
jgi:response regulator NasT